MTKDRLESILKRMAKDRWSPRLIDKESGESWSFSTTLMACEDGVSKKRIPKDICSRKRVFIEIDMEDESMIDEGIKRDDMLTVRLETTVSDGDVVLVDRNERDYVMVYFKDKDDKEWLLPRNARYSAICMSDEENLEIVGRVVNLERRNLRVEYSECAKIMDEAKKRMAKPREISKEHASWCIRQIQSIIVIKRVWFAVYRAMVQMNVLGHKDYDGFCKWVAREVPNHEALPKSDELQRMEILSFCRPIEKWEEMNAPVTGTRFYKYREIGIRMLDLLDSEEETPEKLPKTPEEKD